MLIKISNLPKSKAGNIYATTLTGERYTFATKDIANEAKVDQYAWAQEVTSDSTYKRDAANAVVMENGAPVLVKREGGPVKFNQITKVFATQADAFRAKNATKLDAVAERVFLKKEIAALGTTEGLEMEEINAILQQA